MHISITPETLFHIGALPVTNTLLTAWLVMLFLIVGSLILFIRIKRSPGNVQAAVEGGVEGLLGFFAGIAGSRETARRFFPIAATIFIFILFSNWAGILPGVGSIGFREAHEGKETFVPLFRSVYSDLNMTIALALVVVTLSHIFGFIMVGMREHVGKFISFKSPIAAFVGFLEIISEFGKIISLSFRLFGNIFAGEVLLTIIAFLIPYVVPVPFLGLELFVGFIQALVFAVLAMVAFSSFSVAHENH
ncbi:MAG: ATP synthase F0 subunit A [Candidatus Taylorbacteria bacterium RIFCSPHIGHO2_02_49_25]|uniref:ATP synthase subunit a n=1 Tax=Candidatus Taylorbacteria bacterium RIFCSPHIGHO2_02_49_25 TaxID=1802305 RepID=A0A1G2MDL8_9BACT|nr:MAG: ATP synthase subunit a [Parcubacteria group bacterium GW2011_GWF2_50_9]OHA20434.1 MAG: ATP synthase F0 subunit A [Candidatus Taylorbacteria bacterium RIFCSPHIGHO2_01_FULL_49_60]OHA21913.1 MAG: ATP synthase F0 subunit A [Candidatus Taylorbacteria bacterium RIFCSPHIGHO2_02_49_25]OHA36639.1 MAG: ATP synthase F0 subunit A [Candidatus Taylorbacteria bacterium RIFCSPLOWO2_02_50_13]OHA41649.1 MAG: ATP synthase F0 subunit A [Candidatus Taylorbacteria bacterium RIFCSPLOWO2_02_FULL_50_120]OHA457